MNQRALMPDYLRLVALFGIVLVNVQYIAFSTFDGVHSASTFGPIDAFAIWLVEGLFFVKTYGLFSFMFGVGLAFQMRSADSKDRPFGAMYRNRILGLILLGVAHACLFFPGDILITYGVMGAVLYSMRNWPVRSLTIMGSALLIAASLVTALLMLGSGEEDPFLKEIARHEHLVMTTGTFSEVVWLRSQTSLFLVPILLLFQGFAALGWFALGLAAVRAGLIDTPNHPLWSRARRYCLLPGIVLNLCAAALIRSGEYGRPVDPA